MLLAWRLSYVGLTHVGLTHAGVTQDDNMPGTADPINLETTESTCCA